jgi:integrase
LHKEHIVPLSPRTAQIVRDLAQTKLGPWVFPGWKHGSHLSNMGMSDTLERMNRTNITVHGFRSTFRDWAGEQTNYPRVVFEHALAHKLKDKAEAAYALCSVNHARTAAEADGRLGDLLQRPKSQPDGRSTSSSNVDKFSIQPFLTLVPRNI